MKPSLSIAAFTGLLTLVCPLQSSGQSKVLVTSEAGRNIPNQTPELTDQPSPKHLPLWMRGGRSGAVRQITFIDHGRFIVTRAQDVTTFVESVIRVHEFPSGKLVQTIRYIGSAGDISHNGLLLASEESRVDYTHALHLWKLQQGKELRKFDAPHTVYQILFSADDKTITVCGSQGFVCMWDVETGMKLRCFQGFTDGVQQIAFSPGDTLLIARGGDSKPAEIRIWDSHTGELKSTISTDYRDQLPLAVSPAGLFMAFAEKPSVMTLMDLTTRKRTTFHISGDKYPQTLVFSPDGRNLLLGRDGFHSNYTGDDYDNTLMLWNTGDTASYTGLSGHSSDVRSAAFSPDGHFIVCGLENGNVPLWDAGTGVLVRKDVSQTSHIKAATFSSDGQAVITFDEQGIIHRWDLRSGDSLSLAQFYGDIGPGAAILRSKELVAVCKPYEATVNLVSSRTGESMMTLSAGKAELKQMTFSLSGKLLLASSQEEIFLWQTASRRPLRRIKEGWEPRIHLAFAPDEKRFAASLPNSKNILVWKINSKEPPVQLSVKESHYPQHLVFSPDGNFLAADYHYGPVRIWDLTRKEPARLLEPASTSLAYSPDGNYLATSDTYGTINICNTKTWALVATLDSPFKAIYETLEWSTDKRYLLGVTHDGAVALWNIPELAR